MSLASVQRVMVAAAAVALTGLVHAADISGAGATFPYPIYSKWFADYAAKTGVKINYQSIGSGGGIRQLTEGTVDFGASDAPMTDQELAKAQRDADAEAAMKRLDAELAGTPAPAAAPAATPEAK